MRANPQVMQQCLARLPIKECLGWSCALDYDWARPFSGLMSRALASYRNNITILIARVFHADASTTKKLMATKLTSQQHNSKLELQPHLLILEIVVHQGRQTSCLIVYRRNRDWFPRASLDNLSPEPLEPRSNNNP